MLYLIKAIYTLKYRLMHSIIAKLKLEPDYCLFKQMNGPSIRTRDIFINKLLYLGLGL